MPHLDNDAAQVVVKTDLVNVDAHVAGVHFPSTYSSEDLVWIGRRAVVATLSDILVRGGQGHSILCSISCPAIWLAHGNTGGLANFQQAMEGVFAAASEFDCDLVGGNITVGAELQFHITILGRNGRVLRDSLAKPGWKCGVIEPVGDVVLARKIPEMWAETNSTNPYTHPQLDLSLFADLECLDELAMTDITDGLDTEIRTVARRSGLAFDLDEDALPRSEIFFRAADSLGALTASEQLELRYGGDMYSPLLIFSDKSEPRLRRLIENKGRKLYAVGRFFTEISSTKI